MSGKLRRERVFTSALPRPASLPKPPKLPKPPEAPQPPKPRPLPGYEWYWVRDRRMR